ncbi:MAG: type II secretion system F family protein [Steroidobacteraceae bacterium]
MPAFSYRAVDRLGATQAGEIAASSRLVALESLSGQGLIPIEVAEGREPRVDGPALRLPKLLRTLSFRPGSRRLSPRALLRLTESLAALLRAGLTVDRALQISAALLAARSQQTVRDLLERVRSGTTLSGAFEAGRQPLPPYYLSMVEAGEAGGSLPEALARLAELIRRQLEVRERVISALFYPAILAGVVLLTLIMLLTVVLPRFDAMFAEADAPIPRMTRLVLSLGDSVSSYWWLIALALSAFLLATLAWLRSARGRLTFDGWALRTRWSVGLPAALNTARFLRTVSTLSRNGLPLPSALKVARGTLVNRCLFNALGEVTREVQAGEALSSSFSRAGVFPAIAVQLARVGEETGQLEEMLQSAADVLEGEAHIRLERILTLIVPATIILMGLVVATLIGSVLIGLLSINDLGT